MQDKIRAAVIGVGHMGQYHVGIYSELNDIDLVGVADISKERVTHVAQKYNTNAYIDYKDLFGKVDVVTISVPTSIHYQVAKPFIEKGIHVLLEKPVANTLEEATELFALAGKNRSEERRVGKEGRSRWWPYN